MKLDDAQLGRAALYAAVAGTVLAPVAALSRFATEDGKADLESAAVRAWAEPAADKLAPLLDWASPDTVYLTYGKLWAPILLTMLLCAFAVRRRRQPTGGETWGWRLLLTGFVGMTIGVTGSYWTPLLDEFFVAALPFILIAIVGGVVLGISLLRRGFRPRATAALLIAWLPLFFVLSDLIAMGAALLPALWAWAIAGWSLATGADEPAAVTAIPAGAQ
jgi:hypothetical protein